MFFKNSLFIFALFITTSFAFFVIETKPRLDGRIVGGFEIDITQAPWQVSLQTGGKHFCGGSIIGAKWILTAAHCTFNRYPEDIVIKSGSTEYKSGVVTRVNRIFNNINFNPNTIDFDFALLELAELLRFDEFRKPILLHDSTRNLVDGSLSLVTGWGTTQNINESNKRLRGAEIPIVSQTQCIQAYRRFNTITARMVCAGFMQGGRDSCQGDSGGPLVQFNNYRGGQPELVGVVSWGYGCAMAGFPGVYARVSQARPWIKQITGI